MNYSSSPDLINEEEAGNPFSGGQDQANHESSESEQPSNPSGEHGAEQQKEPEPTEFQKVEPRMSITFKELTPVKEELVLDLDPSEQSDPKALEKEALSNSCRPSHSLAEMAKPAPAVVEKAATVEQPKEAQ